MESYRIHVHAYLVANRQSSFARLNLWELSGGGFMQV